MKHICILVLILCTCFVSAAWSQQPAGTGNSDWTEFHRTNMMRWNPYEHVLGIHNVRQLQLKWSYTTGAPVDFSSPAVVNDVVYIGSDDDNVYALDSGTGTLLWSYPTGGPVASSPAVVGGVVYVGSYDGNVYALNATSGVALWSYPAGGGYPDYPESSPAIADGVVYIGSTDNNVYALNASTGAKLWSYTTGGIVDSSPAVANGVVYVGSWDRNVYALNASTGALLWSYRVRLRSRFLARSGERDALLSARRPPRVRAERQYWRASCGAIVPATL